MAHASKWETDAEQIDISEVEDVLFSNTIIKHFLKQRTSTSSWPARA